MKTVKGFTLIELMIVVVIVAILAAVAIPSYQNSIQKTRRADAKETLTRIAAAQERYFFTNNRYGKLSELGLSVTSITVGGATSEGADSTEGHYTITLANPDNMDGSVTTCKSGSEYPCFKLQATAKLTGSQSKDTECKTFTITHTGQKSATSADCW